MRRSRFPALVLLALVLIATPVLSAAVTDGSPSFASWLAGLYAGFTDWPPLQALRSSSSEGKDGNEEPIAAPHPEDPTLLETPPSDGSSDDESGALVDPNG